jgi:NADPH-dependent ferric siderophore reductase
MIVDIINQHTPESSMETTQRAPRVQRLRHEPMRRELEVARAEALGPHMRSITLTGEALDSFVSASFDDHVKLLLEIDGEIVRRDYTPRRYDAARRELTIEFDLHADGPAARWAAAARPGQRVAVGGPRGSFVVALDHDWHLLVGDETALPAISRRLEELPASTRAIVVLRVADPADRRPLPTAAHLQLQWVDSDTALLDAVRALVLPPGEGYAWCAGEASVMAALRRVLVDEKGHDRRAIRAAAYWKRGAAAHHENLED